MDLRPLIFLLSALLLISCHKKEREIVVTETRERTLFDEQRPLSLIDVPPAGWRQIPSTGFRQLNYVAGEGEKVEIFVGRAGGSVVENANRWLAQFGKEPVKAESDLTSLPTMGTTAYLLEATGDYSPGMGQAPQTDQGMFGALVSLGGDVLTIKLVGPREAAEAMRQDFLNYCKSLEQSKVNQFEPREKGTETKEETTKGGSY